jgi:hypothetical protein
MEWRARAVVGEQHSCGPTPRWVATELSSLDRVSRRLKALRRSVSPSVRQAPSEPIVICQVDFCPCFCIVILPLFAHE